jgi:hypothetical protein
MSVGWSLCLSSFRRSLLISLNELHPSDPLAPDRTVRSAQSNLGRLKLLHEIQLCYEASDSPTPACLWERKPPSRLFADQQTVSWIRQYK